MKKKVLVNADEPQRKLRKLEDELWREIPGSLGVYMVSNYGRVKSYFYDRAEGKFVKASVIKGYFITHIKIDKKAYRPYVHKLVAEVWLEKPSDEHVHVTHIDRNKRNNKVENLKWVTKQEVIEINKLIISQRTEKVINNSKLKASDIVLLKSMLQRGVQQYKIAKMFCISEMQVTRIKRGENWGHVTVPDVVESEVSSENVEDDD